MCRNVGLGAAVENLEEIGDLLDRGGRVVYFGAQGIHKTIGEQGCQDKTWKQGH